MQRRPSSVFRPGCSFIVILGDHFQRCCSSLSRSINQSLPSLHRSSAPAHTFAARVHPPTPLSFTLRDESASVPALLPPMQRQPALVGITSPRDVSPRTLVQRGLLLVDRRKRSPCCSLATSLEFLPTAGG